jgi:DNA-binding CsgD family transcriptional regulator
MRSLIGHVYSAAADETQWLGVLERLGDEFGGAVAGLQYRTGPEGHVRWARFARLDPALTTRLLNDYALRNPWIRATHALWRPGVVIPTHRAVPVSELRRTAYYDGILRPAGVEHGFGGCLFRHGDGVLNFTVVRSDTNGPYEPRELTRVRAILPHVRRAVEINQRLARLERTRATLADGLERLPHGIFLVGRSGRVTFANRTARDLAAQRDGLTIAADGLTAAAPAERRALRSLVDEAVRTSSGEDIGGGGAMHVSRPSSKRPFNLLVTPLRLAPEAGAPPGLATVFVADPERAPQTSEAVVRRQYGLSAAEARLATTLAATGSLERAADALSIARETARWHLKRIYRKTGTHSQSALLGQLLLGAVQVALELV